MNVKCIMTEKKLKKENKNENEKEIETTYVVLIEWRKCERDCLKTKMKLRFSKEFLLPLKLGEIE